MKTQLIFTLAGAFFAIFGCSVCAGTYSGGTGEPNNPYQIADANDLLDLGGTTTDYDKCFILTADIDMGGQVFTTAIIAVDTSSDYDFQGTAFTGTFDGNGYKITNFAIDGGSNKYLGLFGYINTGSSVKNLGLENCAVSGGSGSSLTGPAYVGGLVGHIEYGSISDCYSTGSVSGSSDSQVVGGLVGYNLYGSISNCYSTGAVSGSSSVGGLVGSNSGIISNCYSTGAVSGSDYYYISRVGGLVGSNSSIISNCYSTGAVSVSGSSGSQDVGGLVGSNGGSISDCYSTGTVSGSGSWDVGGLVGYNGYGNISDCYSTGTVSGTGYVGGLVGFNKSSSSSFISIINCYSTGAVSGSSSVGGLVGYKEWGSISNCYSTGSVTGRDDSWGVGGLVGSNVGIISNCYSTGAVSGPRLVGGLVGYNEGSSISHCYFLITSGPDNGYGTPLSDEEMKQQSSFVGWDFTNETANGTNDYWRMCVDGVDYPRLNWESIAGDFMCPDGVNVEDLDYFLQRWLLGDCTLDNNYCGGVDINGSGAVDFVDFAIFAQHWLEGI
jgi:hypothetical protein